MTNQFTREQTHDDIDEAVVLRRLSGDTSVPMNHAERVEIVRRARRRGWSIRDLERIAGIAKAERHFDEIDQLEQAGAA
jgi:hypothetical protein